MKRVGIEKGLNTVADYLSRQGYSVQELSESIESNVQDLSVLDAIVVSDINSDMMGFSDTTTKAAVINASGLTPEEIKTRLDQINIQ